MTSAGGGFFFNAGSPSANEHKGRSAAHWCVIVQPAEWSRRNCCGQWGSKTRLLAPYSADFHIFVFHPCSPVAGSLARVLIKTELYRCPESNGTFGLLSLVPARTNAVLDLRLFGREWKNKAILKRSGRRKGRLGRLKPVKGTSNLCGIARVTLTMSNFCDAHRQLPNYWGQ